MKKVVEVSKQALSSSIMVTSGRDNPYALSLLDIKNILEIDGFSARIINESSAGIEY